GGARSHERPRARRARCRSRRDGAPHHAPRSRLALPARRGAGRARRPDRRRRRARRRGARDALRLRHRHHAPRAGLKYGPRMIDTTTSREVDAVVIGAGTAGVHAAKALAEIGLRVVVLERRAEAQGGGAHWCNAVLAKHFDLAGLPIPEAPEVRARGGASLLFSPSGAYCTRVDETPMWECDMRLLGKRLREGAEANGAEVVYGVDRLDFRFEGERPVAVCFRVGGAF